MGVKAIKEKYNIEHIVKKENGNILIGSPYYGDIIVINSRGKIIKLYKNREYDDGWNTNEDLKRYQEEMLIDQETGELERLFNLSDSFDSIKPVFTHANGRVIKKYCENYGWPHTTIDGELMYENTFFKSYEEALKSLLENTMLKYDWKNYKQNISESISRIKRNNKQLLQRVQFYLYARTIQRLVGIFNNLKTKSTRQPKPIHKSTNQQINP